MLTEWSGVGFFRAPYLVLMEADTESRHHAAAPAGQHQIYRDLRKRNERRAHAMRVLAAKRNDRVTQALLARVRPLGED